MDKQILYLIIRLGPLFHLYADVPDAILMMRVEVYCGLTEWLITRSLIKNPRRGGDHDHNVQE